LVFIKILWRAQTLGFGCEIVFCAKTTKSLFINNFSVGFGEIPKSSHPALERQQSYTQYKCTHLYIYPYTLHIGEGAGRREYYGALASVQPPRWLA
jgi:hypothetical protein